MRTCRSDKWRSHKSESTDAEHRGGVARSSDEVSAMDTERRGYIIQLFEHSQPEMGGTGASDEVLYYFQADGFGSV